MTTVAEDIQKSLRLLQLATVLVVIMLLAVGGYAWYEADNRRTELEVVAESTNHALCSLRDDLKRRVETSERFLANNPDGIPGISAEEIQTGIDNQKRTIDALSNLECD